MLHFLTINIHKGFSPFNQRFILHSIREAIRSSEADIVFLQEVTGENSRKARVHHDWPEETHYEFLAREIWPYFVYGKNAAYTVGHHGNAILSKYPISFSRNIDISTNRIEKRGMLYSVVTIPDFPYPLHCICVHLGLLAQSRKKQLDALEHFIRETIAEHEPIVLAGDFNEWRKKKRSKALLTLGLKDAALETHGRNLRTFPSWLPMLPLDRIFLRGMTATHSRLFHKGIWARLSDHAAFCTQVTIDRPAENR